MTQQLSLAANAVLTAVTLTKYDVPPEGLPAFAEEMAPLLAAALRAAADQCKIEWNYHPDYPETEWVVVASDLLAIANELEAL